MEQREIRLLTWNVNGLRAILQRLQVSLKCLLDELEADVICFQETKLTRSEMDEDLARPLGFDAYYSFSRKRSGYSGVVTFCKTGVVPVLAAEEGLTGFWPTQQAVGHYGQAHQEFSSKELAKLESEGRVVITDHGAFVLVNAYCPALASAERLQYKLDFHEILLDRVRTLQNAGKKVILVGDINVAHRRIDHCDPDSCCSADGTTFEQHPCRQWMDSFVVSEKIEDSATADHGKLLDLFRDLHPTRTKAFTCWNTVTSARENNYGTRIDYILAHPSIVAKHCEIEPDRQGSDHCPVRMDFAVQWLALAFQQDAPSFCAKYFVEFAGKQQTLHGFLAKNQHTTGQEQQPEERNAKAPSGLSSLPQRRGIKRKARAMNGAGATQQISIKSFFNCRHARAAAPPPATPPKAKDHSESLHQNQTRHQDKATGDPLVRVCQQAADWRQVLSGKPPDTPLCWHQEPSVLRVVLKRNSNFGRKFYVCNKPAGEKNDPNARCEFFQWKDKNPSENRKSYQRHSIESHKE